MTPTETKQTFHSCPECGSIVDDHAAACPFCEATLSSSAQSADDESGAREKVSAGPPASLEGAVAPTSSASNVRVIATASPPPPEWRREVSSRVESYRSRRRTNESQEPPDFSGESGEINRADPEYRARLRRDRHQLGDIVRRELRSHSPEQIEIAAPQPAFEFTTADDPAERPDRKSARLVPVAGLDERWRAAMYDGICLTLAFGVFLVLFGSLGGRISLAKHDLLVSLAVFGLLYAVYFVLFTGLGGVTPGLESRGLSVVSFDGSAPTTTQLLWRSFGYLVSAGTLMLGFLWALWDEDELTWHDRISQTYVSSAEPVNLPDAQAQTSGETESSSAT